MLAGLGTAARRACESAGLLRDVQLERRTGAVDPATGLRSLAAAVTLRGRVDSLDALRITSNDSLSTARHTVTIFDGDTNVSPGDVVTWDGEAHTVLEVRGFVIVKLVVG